MLSFCPGVAEVQDGQDLRPPTQGVLAIKISASPSPVYFKGSVEEAVSTEAWPALRIEENVVFWPVLRFIIAISGRQ